MLKVAEAPANSSADKTQAWLDEQLRRARGGVVTVTAPLTPALAGVLLERNPANRRLGADVVEKYARDMKNGAWRLNGEPIIVSADGLLNDGQHRCAAVVESGHTIMAIFVFGVGRDTRMTLDQGKARRASDFLGMHGHVDSIALAAAGVFLWQLAQHGRVSSQAVYRPTKSEQLAVIDEHPGLIASLAAIDKKGSLSVGGRPMLGFCHYVFSEAAGEPSATSFMRALTSGAALAARDPILYARNRLMAERGRLRSNERAELIFRAWNAHRRRETPKTLPILGGELPLVER